MLGLCQASFSFSDQGDYASAPRSDSHAPIGIMGDHLHGKGEWMLSYRHMDMRMEGHRAGSDKLTAHEVFMRGFSAAATSMDMKMDMFGIMYAPSDRVTLMGMVNHIDLEMDMVMSPNAGMSGMHDMHSAGGMTHATSGWGDVGVMALIKAFDNRSGRKAHWNLGVTAPTGSVTEKMHETYQPYGMQLGSATWDAKIGATYLDLNDTYSWGGQILGTVRLEDMGDSGFSRANALETSIWGTWKSSTALSFSGRLKYSTEGTLNGHYNGLHAHAAPPHLQSNYGGDVLEVILGINYLITDGMLNGHRIALEVGMPVYQDLNGVGMNRKEMVTLGWQLAL